MPQNPASPQPPLPVRLRITGHCLVSDPTLRKYFRGQRVYPSIRFRVETALRELGLAEFIVPETSPEDGGDKDPTAPG